MVGSRGSTLNDRELYLPKGWCDDPDRCDEAGVPQDISFMTKPRLAQQMIGRALDQGLCPKGVLGDEVYGSDSKTRRFLESRGHPMCWRLPRGSVGRSRPAPDRQAGVGASWL